MANKNVTLTDDSGNNLYPITVSDNVIGLDAQINNITTLINNKANIDLSNVVQPTISGNGTFNGNDRVIKTVISSNGTQWYRIWKSGFKECGGLVTFSGSAWQTPVITFPIPNGFTSVKTINFTQIRQSGYDGNFYGFIYDYSNTQFRVTTYVTAGTQDKGFFYACGY